MGRDSRPAPPTADEAPRERLSPEPAGLAAGAARVRALVPQGWKGRAARGPSRSAGAQPTAYPGRRDPVPRAERAPSSSPAALGWLPWVGGWGSGCGVRRLPTRLKTSAASGEAAAPDH